MALIHCQFYSQVLGLMSTMSVILPDPPPSEATGIQTNARPRYPTLYLLHGMSDDHTAWQRQTAIERYVAGLNLAVVMPAVQRSYYANMTTGLRYWTFISEEVPALAHRFFPLSTRRDETYVAGLSMGGYGAFKLALTFPDRYAAAASLSGALDVVARAQTDAEAGIDELGHIFGPIDSLVGSSDDLFALAQRLSKAREPRPLLYQWCGTEDSLYADNVRFHAHAKALGLDIRYEEGPGGHTWACWDAQIQRVLAWLPGVGQL